jgi:trk system potassium uptake protein TrkH
MINNRDVRIVGFNLGRVVKNIGLLLLFPMPVCLIYFEVDVIPDFIMAASVSYSLGLILQILFHTGEEIRFKHAMAISSLVWIFGSVLAGLPLWTSGSVKSVLDGTFDGMSGWTTSGLSVIPDIDHLSHSINFWRHLTQFIGGAGIVVFGLALLTKSVSGASRLYVSEGRDEKIYPSITKTAKAIFGICLMFLALGSVVLTVIGLHEGMSISNSLFDAMMTTMAAFSTGGFSPHSQNLLFYHSTAYEIAAIVISIIGAFNFALHFSVLTGNRQEMRKNFEIITITATIVALTLITMTFLIYFNVYSDYLSLFRKGFFQLVSGHTTTGFQTINVIQFTRDWPYLSLFAVTVSMLLGACACSTGGGIKALRVGIIVKMFIREVKKMILPENAVIIEKYHHIHKSVINDRTARGAMLVAMGYILLFAGGSLVTMFYGYSMIDSMFETASALGNTGLSIGITSYQMPWLLKVNYIFLMWVGRLEIISVFVLLGIVYVGVKQLSYASAGAYHSSEMVASKIMHSKKKETE